MARSSRVFLLQHLSTQQLLERPQTHATRLRGADEFAQIKALFQSSRLGAAACQGKLALVVSMRIRNAGESLSRPLPRVQCTRRCRRRLSNHGLKRRTSKCTSSPPRVANSLPIFPPAAPAFPSTPTCRRWPSYYIHKYRDNTGTVSTIPYVAPPLHVTAISIFLRCELSATTSTDKHPQAQSPR